MTNRHRSILLAGALGAAALFVAPGLLLAFTVIGGTLGIGTSGNGYQRDVRIRNNAADAASNNNTTPEPSYPGALGAPMAVWKGAEAWSSDTFNTTFGGNVNRNFDMDWQGENPATPGVNDNTARWLASGGSCGGGVLAYMEPPLSDGWRITFCDSFTWSDGPGSPGFNQFDIQGVMTHEYGHSLGLGHTTVNCGTCNDTVSGHSTMCAFICASGVTERTINTDDRAGLEFLYGTVPANKPTITSLGGSFSVGGTLLINGTNFASTVNVKFTAGTTQNTGAIPGVVYGVPASPTLVSVTIPAAAQDGNVLVWEPGINRLSNAFPIDVVAGPPPPTITGVSPSMVQAFQGGTITLSGSGFTGATQVNSGGTILVPPAFTVVDDDTITYGAPNAIALGLTTVNVTTPEGTSNDGTFTYVETHPPRLAAPATTSEGASFTWDFGGGSADTFYLVGGTDPTTFTFQGYSILSNTSRIRTATLSAVGIGSYTITVPAGTSGLTFYSQVVTFNGGGGGFVGASNIVTTSVF